MKQRIKINAIVIAVSILFVAVFPYVVIRRSASTGDDVLEVIGISFILLGQLLRVSARGYKAHHSQNGNKLIQEGPYALVRNPMYLGIILIGLGVVLSICNLWVLILFAIGFLSRYFMLFKKEEAVLLKAFGNQFATYVHKVPRLVPRFSVLAQDDICRYLPLKLAWFRSELISILPVLLVVLAIEFSEEAAYGGVSAIIRDSAVFLGIVLMYLILILFLARRYETSSRKGKGRSA